MTVCAISELSLQSFEVIDEEEPYRSMRTRAAYSYRREVREVRFDLRSAEKWVETQSACVVSDSEE